MHVKIFKIKTNLTCSYRYSLISLSLLKYPINADISKESLGDVVKVFSLMRFLCKIPLVINTQMH